MKRAPRILLLSLLLAAGSSGAGCVTNPVTGNRQLQLMTSGQEIRTGDKYYRSARQSEGGDFTADPALSEYVSAVGSRLAAASDRPDLPYQFVVTNTAEPHAWALPGGKIGISRGLILQLQSEAELAFVLGHQIAHAAARHGSQALGRDWLKKASVATVAIGATVFGVPALPLVGLVSRGEPTSEWLVNRKHGKGEEMDADSAGMDYMKAAGYDPQAAVDLMTGVHVDAEVRKLQLESDLYHAHPLSAERISGARLKAHWMEDDGDAVETYAERYSQATLWLRERNAAYLSFERGRAALAEGDADAALQQAMRALAQAPSERRFHELAGDAFMQKGLYTHALESYDSAIASDPTYAFAYVRRGLARKALADLSGAKEDFLTSDELEPNAIARHQLGRLPRKVQFDEPMIVQQGAYNAWSTPTFQTTRSAPKKSLEEHLDDVMHGEDENLLASPPTADPTTGLAQRGAEVVPTTEGILLVNPDARTDDANAPIALFDSAAGANEVAALVEAEKATASAADAGDVEEPGDVGDSQDVADADATAGDSEESEEEVVVVGDAELLPHTAFTAYRGIPGVEIAVDPASGEGDEAPELPPVGAGPPPDEPADPAE